MRSQKYPNCIIKERANQKREGVFQVKKENVFFKAFVAQDLSF